jgi:hypothetical protein
MVTISTPGSSRPISMSPSSYAELAEPSRGRPRGGVRLKKLDLSVWWESFHWPSATTPSVGTQDEERDRQCRQYEIAGLMMAEK